MGNIFKFLICTLLFFHLFWNDFPARPFIFSVTKKPWTTPPITYVLHFFSCHTSSYFICKINFCWNISPLRGFYVWLFATKDLNNRLWLWIQYKTIILSIQMITFPISNFIIFATDLAKLNPSTAPHNSSLGILVDCRGATRDLDITIFEVISPLHWIQRAYITAPHAFFEASAKTCNDKEPLSPDGTKHLGTLISGSSCKSWNYFTASSLQSLFNCSFQSIPYNQIFCISTVALVIYGAKNPSGQKMISF